LCLDDEPDSLEVAAHPALLWRNRLPLNGKDGLAAIRQKRPKFVISDLSMPVMDGWEMLFEIQQDRYIAQIPIIALTAHAMVGDRTRAIEAGFYNYLTKPLTPATFMGDLLRLLLDVPDFQAALSA
jgi:CheY-like chemotaxis protein